VSVVVRRVRLECRNAAVNAFKFWSGDIEEMPDGRAILTTRWGRIGTYGQRATEECATVGYAMWALDKKIAEKLGRGYAVTDDRQPVMKIERPVPGALVGRSARPVARSRQPQPKTETPEDFEPPVRRLRLTD
jgi:predicted DNA-binding WGR domain protein